MFNLNNQTINIKTIDNIIFRIQSTSIIDFYIFVENKHMHIKLSNIFYLSKLDTNLILLKIFKKKKYKF